MSSLQLYPEVVDGTDLGAVFSQDQFLVVGVEGEMMPEGTADVGTAYAITRPADANTLFFGESPIGLLVKFLLNRGVALVFAVASGDVGDVDLVDRKAAWEALEDNELVRIRLTTSGVQADLVALAESAENADGVGNKQIAFLGMPTGTSKATLISAAGAIASSRGVLVGPGIYDSKGVLLGGQYAAAAAAAEVSKNPDIADDLDTLVLLGLTGTEKDTNSLPLFRRRTNAGTPENDFEDLLQEGVSPLEQTRRGEVRITHLRTTATTDSTWDALQTRLIVDQLFLDVKNYAETAGFLRRGNTKKTRDDLRAGVEALLVERQNWLQPKLQSDGNFGYGTTVVSSLDGRQVTVSYEGTIVRGIQTILVDGKIEITA